MIQGTGYGVSLNIFILPKTKGIGHKFSQLIKVLSNIQYIYTCSNGNHILQYVVLTCSLDKNYYMTCKPQYVPVAVKVKPGYIGATLFIGSKNILLSQKG